jgi:hypothetical protein
MEESGFELFDRSLKNKRVELTAQSATKQMSVLINRKEAMSSNYGITSFFATNGLRDKAKSKLKRAIFLG